MIDPEREASGGDLVGAGTDEVGAEGGRGDLDVPHSAICAEDDGP